MTDNPFQDSDDIDLSTEEMDPQSDPGTLDDMPDLQQSQAEELDSLEYEAPPVTDLPPAQFEESGPSDLDSLSTPDASEPDDLGDTVDLEASEPDDLMDIGDPEQSDTSDDLPAVSFQDDFDYNGGLDTPETSTTSVAQLPQFNFTPPSSPTVPGTGYKTAGTYFGF